MNQNTIIGGERVIVPAQPVGFWAEDADTAEDNENRPAQQQQGRQAPAVDQTIVQSIAQALAPLQQGQDRLRDQLGYLTRKVGELETKGARIPDELRQQIVTMSESIEEQRVAEMTTQEQIDYWRTKKTSGNEEEADSNNGAKPLDTAMLKEQAATDYVRVEARMKRMSDALGLEWKEVAPRIQQIRVNADQGGRLQWDEWEDTATGWMQEVRNRLDQQEQTVQEAPARNAGRALGAGTRPGGPAASAAPDFMTAEPDDLARFAIAQERAAGRR